jgi:general secretion pathway protein G
MSRTIRRPRPVLRRAFTILELLIVIGIILAIGGLVLVNVLGASEKADKSLVQAQIQAFNRALEQYKVEMKRYPSEDEEELARWGGPYLKEPNTTDLWGNEWIYRNPSEIEGVAYDIVSIGPDKEEGTDDDITSNDGKSGADGEPLDDFSDFSPSGS